MGAPPHGLEARRAAAIRTNPGRAPRYRFSLTPWRRSGLCRFPLALAARRRLALLLHRPGRDAPPALLRSVRRARLLRLGGVGPVLPVLGRAADDPLERSEERRVGKAWR